MADVAASLGITLHTTPRGLAEARNVDQEEVASEIISEIDFLESAKPHSPYCLSLTLLRDLFLVEGDSSASLSDSISIGQLYVDNLTHLGVLTVYLPRCNQAALKGNVTKNGLQQYKADLIFLIRQTNRDRYAGAACKDILSKQNFLDRERRRVDAMLACVNESRAEKRSLMGLLRIWALMHASPLTEAAHSMIYKIMWEGGMSQDIIYGTYIGDVIAHFFCNTRTSANHRHVLAAIIKCMDVDVNLLPKGLHITPPLPPPEDITCEWIDNIRGNIEPSIDRLLFNPMKSIRSLNGALLTHLDVIRRHNDKHGRLE